MGLEFALARGSPFTVSDFVMTSQDYTKIGHMDISGFDFLVLVLQNSNAFDLNAFFQVFLS